MKCEEARASLVDLIYFQEEFDFTREFKAHFARCSKCSGEYMELLDTRKLLSAWQDEPPPSSLLFVHAAKTGGWRNWIPSRAWLRPAPAFALSLIILLAFMAFANVRISWQEGRFGFQSGLFAWNTGSSAGNDGSVWVDNDVLEAVDRMLAESEERQTRQAVALLQRMAENFEFERQKDLFQVKGEMGLLHRNYYQALEKNSALLEQTAKVLQRTRY